MIRIFDRKIKDRKMGILIFLSSIFLSNLNAAEDLGEMWGTATEEAKYYPITNIPIPATVPMRPGGPLRHADEQLGLCGAA